MLTPSDNSANTSVKIGSQSYEISKGLGLEENSFTWEGIEIFGGLDEETLLVDSPYKTENMTPTMKKWIGRHLPDCDPDNLTTDEINYLALSVNSRDIALYSEARPYKAISCESFLREEDRPRWAVAEKFGFKEVSAVLGSTPKQISKEKTQGLSYTDGLYKYKVSADLDERTAIAQRFIKGTDFKRGGYDVQDLATIIGIVNHLLFVGAQTFGCFEWGDAMPTAVSDRRILAVKRDRLIEYIESPFTQKTALSSICNHLGRYWQVAGARTRRGTVRKLLRDMSEAGYLEFYSDFEEGVKGQPMMFTYIDVIGMLSLVEAAEQRFTELCLETGWMMEIKRPGCESYEMPCFGDEGFYLPSHMGRSHMELFNALYYDVIGVAKYGRQRWDVAEAAERVDYYERSAREKDVALIETALDMKGTVEFFIERTGERSAKTSYWRREFTNKLARDPWLQWYVDHYPDTESFIQKVVDASYSEYECTSLWADIVDNFYDTYDANEDKQVWFGSGNPSSEEGRWTNWREYAQSAFNYAMSKPSLLGRKAFEQAFWRVGKYEYPKVSGRWCPG